MASTSSSRSSRSWGLAALLLALLAWLALAGTVLSFLASIGVPGDGDNAIRAMRPWILTSLGVLAVSAPGGLLAAVQGWRLRRGRVCAVIAAALLALLLIVAIPLSAILR